MSHCETGILHQSARTTGRPADSAFEIAVMRALEKEGFECEPQVGVAGFFIDVGVRDPGNAGRFLMGIECDGASYHSAKSVRDRDRLRQAVLERLGWKIRRIWSTDWFRNPKAELTPIIRELHALKSPQQEKELAEQTAPAQAIIQQDVAEPAEDGLWVQAHAFKPGELKDKLMRFDEQVIRKACPDTPENRRLLRPAMLEAMLEYQPGCREEFLEMIPAYLRQAIAPAEGRYLERIFEIINASAIEPAAEQSA